MKAEVRSYIIDLLGWINRNVAFWYYLEILLNPFNYSHISLTLSRVQRCDLGKRDTSLIINNVAVKSLFADCQYYLDNALKLFYNYEIQIA